MKTDLIESFLEDVCRKYSKNRNDALNFFNELKYEIANNECEAFGIEDIFCYYEIDFKYIELFIE